jgi:hypothetical protein
MSEVELNENSDDEQTVKSIIAQFSSSSLYSQWKKNRNENEFDYYGKNKLKTYRLCVNKNIIILQDYHLQTYD